MLSQSEIEKYLNRCEFDDECDYCDNPISGSYAIGYSNTESGIEVDGYCCGKCATGIVIPAMQQEQIYWAEQSERMDKYFRENES